MNRAAEFLRDWLTLLAWIFGTSTAVLIVSVGIVWAGANILLWCCT